jgi:hypothetical protein
MEAGSEPAWQRRARSGACPLNQPSGLKEAGYSLPVEPAIRPQRGRLQLARGTSHPVSERPATACPWN